MHRKRFEIYSFQDEFIPKLKELAKEYPYGRFNEDVFLNKQKSILYSVDTVLKDCREARASTFVNLHDQDRIGLICIQKSAWDTELMGFGVAIIKHLIVKARDFDQRVKVCLDLIAAACNWFKKEGIRFVFVKIPARDLAVINALCRAGYLYIENYVYNSFDLSKSLPELDNKYHLRRFNSGCDIEFLFNFSKNAFINQRFHADPYLGHALAEKLYSKWIRTSIESKDDCIVALENSSKTLGFLIYTHNDLSRQLGIKFSQWKFAVIEASEREKGIGRQLFISTLKLNLEEGCQITDSGLSMNNIHSLNLHNRVGFRIISGSVVFHHWIPDKK